MTPTMEVVLAAMRVLADGSNVFEGHADAIASHAGCSIRSVYTAHKALAEQDYITRIRGCSRYGPAQWYVRPAAGTQLSLDQQNIVQPDFGSPADGESATQIDLDNRDVGDMLAQIAANQATMMQLWRENQRLLAAIQERFPDVDIPPQPEIPLEDTPPAPPAPHSDQSPVPPEAVPGLLRKFIHTKFPGRQDGFGAQSESIIMGAVRSREQKLGVPTTRGYIDWLLAKMLDVSNVENPVGFFIHLLKSEPERRDAAAASRASPASADENPTPKRKALRRRRVA